MKTPELRSTGDYFNVEENRPLKTHPFFDRLKEAVKILFEILSNMVNRIQTYNEKTEYIIITFNCIRN